MIKLLGSYDPVILVVLECLVVALLCVVGLAKEYDYDLLYMFLKRLCWGHRVVAGM